MSTLIFSDTCAGTNGANVFSRTPDTVGTSYSASGTITATIQTNTIQLSGTSTTDAHVLFNPATTTPNDQSVSADCTQGATYNFPGVVVRFVDSNNYIMIRHNQFVPQYELYTIVSGTATVRRTVGTGGWSVGITHNMQLSVIGTTVTWKIDGVAQTSYTLTGGETALASGKSGLYFNQQGGSGNTFDNLLAYDEGTATPSLIITTQPTTTASGNPISPSVVVKATTNGVTVDTAATGSCVGTLPGGAMYGTTTLNFTAGVATFSALVPGGAARSDALHFASTGYTAVDSTTFPITSGSGSTIRTYEERIVRPIKVAEATNTRRRIALRLVDTANAATAVSMTGRKAQLSSAGGAETASTADITQVGTTSRGYVELSLAEATALTAGDYVEARVVAATGLAEYVGCAEVFPDDPYAAALTSVAIANATVEAEITALKTYARGTNTSYAITGPTSGVNSRTITTDGSYLPFKSA